MKVAIDPGTIKLGVVWISDSGRFLGSRLIRPAVKNRKDREAAIINELSLLLEALPNIHGEPVTDIVIEKFIGYIAPKMIGSMRKLEAFTHDLKGRLRERFQCNKTAIYEECKGNEPKSHAEVLAKSMGLGYMWEDEMDALRLADIRGDLKHE